MSRDKHGHQELSGKFEYVIFSPKGDIEGILLDVKGKPTQLVVDAEADDSARVGGLKAGQKIVVEAAPQKPSHKGEAVHALHRLHKLLSVDGKKISGDEEAPDVFSGTVVRFNFAKHGEPNGVVLDSGDFIHLRPEGMAAVELKLGDHVVAEGESRRLYSGNGRVVEAEELNGKKVKKKGPPRH